MIRLITKKKRFFTCTLILTVLCSQLFSVVHFHHSHHDNDLQIIVSSHPINQETKNHSDYHNGEHHHDGDEHIEGNWNFVKPIPRLAFYFSTNSLWITNFVFDENLEQISIIQIVKTHQRHKQVYLSPSLSRGPPAYLS